QFNWLTSLCVLHRAQMSLPTGDPLGGPRKSPGQLRSLPGIGRRTNALRARENRHEFYISAIAASEATQQDDAGQPRPTFETGIARKPANDDGHTAIAVLFGRWHWQ